MQYVSRASSFIKSPQLLQRVCFFDLSVIISLSQTYCSSDCSPAGIFIARMSVCVIRFLLGALLSALVDAVFNPSRYFTIRPTNGTVTQTHLLWELSFFNEQINEAARQASPGFHLWKPENRLGHLSPLLVATGNVRVTGRTCKRIAHARFNFCFFLFCLFGHGTD